MTMFRHHYPNRIAGRFPMGILLFILLFFSVFQTVYAVNQPKILVIDPGHGSGDPGAALPENGEEKDFTLALANRLKTILEPRYTVLLTRDGETDPGMYDRTAYANRNGAHLFISLHAGTNPRMSEGFVAVYYYDEGARYFSDKPAGGKSSPMRKTDNIFPMEWDGHQLHWKEQSMTAAESLGRHVNERFQSSGPIIRGIPLLVLTGLDMPGVVFEVIFSKGHSKQLGRERSITINMLADGIGKGVEDFFQRK